MADVVNIFNLRKKIEEIEGNGNQKVCVVGIIGRCHLLHKDGALNQLVDHNVFQTDSKTHKLQPKENKQVEVKMFYDEERKTVFLELNSIHDYAQLLNACRNLHENLSMAGRHHYCQDHLLKHALALLFMFSVSHIVVVMFPTPRFDLTYLRLFKLLASVRYTMLHSLSQSLAAVDGIPEIWKTTGRPCIPRIIFSFQIPWNTAKGLNEHSIRKLQQSLQEQVHLILKKNRLLGSLSSSSLFTVSSPNQLFVHVQSPQKSHIDPISFCINHVLKHSINMDAVYSSVLSKKSNISLVSQPSPTKGTSEDSGGVMKDITLRDFLFKQIDYMMTVESREVPAEGRRGTHVEAPNIELWYRVCEIVYKYFLGSATDNNAHVKTLMQTLDLDWKFSENRCHKVSPMATNTYLDNLPSHYTQSVHLAQLNHCLHVFTMNARGPAYEHFANQLQEECNQVWWNGRHLCEATSMTGQPCVYPYHNLTDGKQESEETAGVPYKSHSSRVTSIAACNCGRTQGTREDPFDLKSANYEFYQDLEKKCCSYLTHLKFPMFPADDPSLRVKRAAPSLQRRLETHQITILGRNAKTSISELSVSGTTSQTQESKDIEILPSQDHEHAARTRTISTSKDLTAASGASLSYGGYQSTDIESRDDGASYVSEYEGMVKSLSMNPVQEVDNELVEVESSNTTDNSSNITTTEHYEGMLSINLSPSLLPMFPSWSLIVLGSASLYNPTKGVEQAGFFTGSNYLLLWDIPVKTNDMTSTSDGNDEPNITDIASQEEQWPVPGEVTKVTTTNQNHPSTTTHAHIPILQTINQVHAQANELLRSDKNPVGRIKRPNSKETISVKAYIGNEYECPRGHRFFCSAADKMVKITGSGHIRENATKLVTAHMPIYFPCPCRSSKPLHLAQLTRTYVVTPDSAVTITLNPRVQPGERDITPVFYTGLKDGVTLPPNSYCVLRFPYVYVGDSGPILPPPPSQPLLTCRLLRGMFNYSYVSNTDDNLI
ncbi:nonsense-mediated mRNA decay factor SMG8-like [Hydractinia symbiolongicarpus]|uniref:nonsense-mediated mRNA decay factor SMG8-like n=1 Tax=Hydractinia symbiolongicarpus TaxID=13093 RepID=UPI00254ADB3B|nr:nonsense-mediated mRNA decay factor SMG8-like [Hydractinia symbiolongicarpus]